MSISRNLFQIFFIITIFGALNWGLVAINSQNDLFLTIFPNSVIARSIFYFIIGIAGIISCYLWLSYPSEMICLLCNEKRVHSFRMIEKTEHHAWFYTNDIEVIDRTPEYVIKHISNELQYYHKNHKDKQCTWSWYYDAQHFIFDFTAMDIFLRMLEVLTKYSSTLCRIHIVPNEMMKNMLQTVHPMLPTRIASLLTFA